MGKEIFKTNLKREAGKLYYIKSDEEGFLIVCEAILKQYLLREEKQKNA